jgi:hypothetical protein
MRLPPNALLEVCSWCSGPVKVIACIEEQDIIDMILAHLQSKDQDTCAGRILNFLYNSTS